MKKWHAESERFVTSTQVGSVTLQDQETYYFYFTSTYYTYILPRVLFIQPGLLIEYHGALGVLTYESL